MRRNLNEAITHIQVQKPQGQALPNGFAHSEPAWITPASMGMGLHSEWPNPPGWDRFAATAVPADRHVRSFAGGWFKVLSFSGREDHITLEMEDQIIPLFPRERIKLPWKERIKLLTKGED